MVSFKVLNDVKEPGWYQFIPERNGYVKIANVIKYAYYVHQRLFINSKDVIKNGKHGVIISKTSMQCFNTDEKIAIDTIDLDDPKYINNLYLAFPYTQSIDSVYSGVSITWMCSANNNDLAVYQISYSR